MGYQLQKLRHKIVCSDYRWAIWENEGRTATNLFATSIKDEPIEYHQTDKRSVKNYSSSKYEANMQK